MYLDAQISATQDNLAEPNSVGGKQEVNGCGVFSWLTADGVMSDINRLGHRWDLANDSNSPGKVAATSPFISPMTSRDTSIYFPLTSCGQSRTALDEQ